MDASIDHGLRNPPVRWVMLASPFFWGVAVYTFYALQPYLLELYGDPKAYTVAGLAAAIVAGAQILGGYFAPKIRGLFKKRTTVLILGASINVVILVLLGAVNVFVIALILLSIWALLFSAVIPIRQAYLNGMIPSKQRATVLSLDNLMGSSGGVVIQPVLGKAADVYSYGTSFAIGGAFQALALPFLFLSRHQRAGSDDMVNQS